MSKPKRRGRPKLRTPKKALTIRLPLPEYRRLAQMAKAADKSICGLASEMVSSGAGDVPRYLQIELHAGKDKWLVHGDGRLIGVADSLVWSEDVPKIGCFGDERRP